MKFFLICFVICFSLISQFLIGNEESYQHSSDHLKFGHLWKYIREKNDPELLFLQIHERREEIQRTKMYWKEKINLLRIDENREMYEKIDEALVKGSLSPSKLGLGGAYFLLDEQKVPCFVVKPVDEDLLCLNNRKQFASPYNEQAFRARTYIPLYRTVQAEVVAYITSREMGMAQIIPKTVMAIIHSDYFHDISDSLENDQERVDFLMHVGEPDREKLCSIQEYVPNTQELFTLLKTKTGVKEVIEKINQSEFEQAIILIWIIYDTDAHAGNIYVSTTSEEEQSYRLHKFDNGLTFPEKNAHLCNVLARLPQAQKFLSLEAKQKIREIPKEKIIDWLYFFEQQNCIDAFLERIFVLQELIERDQLTIAEIDCRLRALELINGTDVALSHLPLEQILPLFQK